MATFGNSSLTGASSPGPDTSGDILGTIYTLPVHGTVTKLTAYAGNSSASSVARCVIYATSSGSVTTLAAISSESSYPITAAEFVDFSLPSPVALPAGDYMLGIWFGGDMDAFYNPSSGSAQYMDTASAGAYSSSSNPTSPWVPTSTLTGSFVVYATYTPTPSSSSFFGLV
jgi:hypothetical protein